MAYITRFFPVSIIIVDGTFYGNSFIINPSIFSLPFTENEIRLNVITMNGLNDRKFSCEIFW